MALVEAKCTNCGGKLKIDNEKDAAICPYCGSAFIVEKGIQLYNQSCFVHGENVNVYHADSGHESASELYSTGTKSLEAGSFDLAKKCFDDIKKYYPSDYRGPLGIMQYWLNHNNLPVKSVFDQEHKDAVLLAGSTEQRQEIERVYSVALNKYRKMEAKRKAEDEKWNKLVIDAEDEKWNKLVIDAEEKLKSAKRGLYAMIATILFWIILFIFFKARESGIAIILGIVLVPGIPALIGVMIKDIIPEIRRAENHLRLCINRDSEGLYWEEHPY